MRTSQIMVGVVLAAVLLWPLSGFYSTGSDQEALVLRFGHMVKLEGAGLHWHLPGIEDVVVVSSRMVRSISLDPEGAKTLRLTGDENILNLKVVVQYTIKDPQKYAFNVGPAEDILRNVLASVVQNFVATKTVDDVLTTAKTEIQTTARTRAQEKLDAYGTGINLVSVNLQEATPPDPVVEAFNDVVTAREDSEKYIHEAEAYTNTVLPAAEGESQQMLQQAQGEADTRKERAEGDVSRFKSILVEYLKAPGLTRRRLLMETMESILPNMKKVVAAKGMARIVFQDLDF